MSDKFRAVNEIRAFANKFKALLEFADELEGVASLEQSANEARGRLEEANKRLDEVFSKIEEATARLRKVEEESDLKRTQAIKIIEDANSRANDIIRSANEERERIIRDANSIVEGKIEEIKRMESELDGLRKMKDKIIEETRNVELNLKKLRAAAASLANMET